MLGLSVHLLFAKACCFEKRGSNVFFILAVTYDISHEKRHDYQYHLHNHHSYCCVYLFLYIGGTPLFQRDPSVCQFATDCTGRNTQNRYYKLPLMAPRAMFCRLKYFKVMMKYYGHVPQVLDNDLYDWSIICSLGRR